MPSTRRGSGTLRSRTFEIDWPREIRAERGQFFSPVEENWRDEGIAGIAVAEMEHWENPEAHAAALPPMPYRANFAEFGARADPHAAEGTNHADHVLVGKEFDVPAGDKGECPGSGRGQPKHQPTSLTRGVVNGGCATPEGHAEDGQDEPRPPYDGEDAAAPDFDSGLHALSADVHRDETALPAEHA